MEPLVHRKILVEETADEHWIKIVVWVVETSEAYSTKDPILRKIRWEEARFYKGKFCSFSVGFFFSELQQLFSEIFSSFPMEF